jgi:putative ubiquitin-RnfH superfamily antitoxin RatB of RatAB toxin-antitoxin module
VAISITLVFSPGPRVLHEVAQVVESGCTVQQAVQVSGLLQGIEPQLLRVLDIGIWGRKVELTHVLRDNDRIEIYRPLTVDPKVARRERFVRQGAKSAGLFSKRRSGAKAGY